MHDPATMIIKILEQTSARKDKATDGRKKIGWTQSFMNIPPTFPKVRNPFFMVPRRQA